MDNGGNNQHNSSSSGANQLSSLQQYNHQQQSQSYTIKRHPELQPYIPYDRFGHNSTNHLSTRKQQPPKKSTSVLGSRKRSTGNKPTSTKSSTPLLTSKSAATSRANSEIRLRESTPIKNNLTFNGSPNNKPRDKSGPAPISPIKNTSTTSNSSALDSSVTIRRGTPKIMPVEVAEPEQPESQQQQPPELDFESEPKFQPQIIRSSQQHQHWQHYDISNSPNNLAKELSELSINDKTFQSAASEFMPDSFEISENIKQYTLQPVDDLSETIISTNNSTKNNSNTNNSTSNSFSQSIRQQQQQATQNSIVSKLEEPQDEQQQPKQDSVVSESNEQGQDDEEQQQPNSTTNDQQEQEKRSSLASDGTLNFSDRNVDSLLRELEEDALAKGFNLENYKSNISSGSGRNGSMTDHVLNQFSHHFNTSS